MVACPNKSLESWKLLVEAQGEDIAHYLWDKYQGEVPKSEYAQLQDKTDKTVPSKASSKTLEAVKEFAKRSGINWKQAAEREGVEGSANILQNLIEVAEGKEDVAFTEEAMHFAVEIMEQTHPALFNRMLSEIGNYQLYRDTLALYRDDYRYQLADGKPNIRKIKKEAIGKVLAETVIEQNQDSVEKPELLAKSQSWWSWILNAIKNLIAKAGFNPFETAAKKVMSEKGIGTIKDIQNKPLAEEIISKRGDDPFGIKASFEQGNYNDVIKFAYDQLNDNFNATVAQVLKGDKVLAEKIMDYGTEYLQLGETVKQDKLFNDIKSNKGVQITKEINPDEKDADGSPKQMYKVGGKWVKRRVTDIVKAYYKGLFGDKELTESEYEKAKNDIIRETGTKGHADLEHAFSTLVDPSTGLLRSERLDDSGYVSQINPEDNRIYTILRDNLAERLQTYPPGTKFLSEVTVYDEKRDMAGTIDFLAITKEGKISILDWKFMNLNTDKNTDVPWYKVGGFKIQISQYKKMLIENYGITNSDFDYQHTEAVPVVLNFKTEPTADEVEAGIRPLPKLKGVKIGKVNVDAEKRDYLLPVALPEQRTGNKKIDLLIDKLQALEESVKDPKAITDEERKNKRELLNSLYTAYRQLQIRKNIAPAIEFAKVLTRQTNEFLKSFNEVTIKRDTASFSKEEASALGQTITKLSDSLSIFIDTDVLLKGMFRNKTLTEADKALEKSLKDTVEEARLALSDMSEAQELYNEKILGGITGIAELAKTQKERGMIDSIFTPTSEQQIKTVQAAWELLQGALEKAAMEESTEGSTLTHLEQTYSDFIKAKGLKANNFSLFKKKDKNELIDEYSPEFYKTLKAKIKENDVAWIKDNVDMEALTEGNKQALERELNRINTSDRFTDEEKEKKIKQAKTDYSLAKKSSLGWYDYNLIKKFPSKEKWQSKEYKELYKKDSSGNLVNDPAVKVYEYIVERNNTYAEIGYITRGEARKFLPFIEKTLMEKIVLGKNPEFMTSFLRSISIDEGTVGFGEYDPISQQVVRKIPKYFTKDTGYQMSDNLFKNLYAYNSMALRYKNMQEIEGMIRALDRMEKAKKVYATGVFNDLQKKEGSSAYNERVNNANYQIFRELTDSVLYGIKYINEGDTALGKIGEIGRKINDKLGIQVFPEKFSKSVGDRTISTNALLDAANTAFQLRVLGLHPLSALSNFIGGNLQADINAGKWYTKATFERNLFQIFSNRFGDNRKIALKMLEYFVPFPNEQHREVMRRLSLYKFSEESMQDALMWMMRTSDINVQSNIFYSLIDNAIVVDGELVNARQYARSLPEFQSRYSGKTVAEMKEVEKKMETKIEELIKEKGIYNFAKLNDKGELEIEGINRESKGVYEVRRITAANAKDALGNLPESEKRRINLLIYGKSFMVFKNWIPSLISKRAKNLVYRSDTQSYEWGRYRTMMSMLMTDTWEAVNTLAKTMIPFGDGTMTESAVSMMEKMYEQKQRDYKEATGENLNMSKDDFIDMVRENIKGQARDVLFYIALMSLYLAASAYGADPDDDKRVKNYHKFILRAADKISDEVGFFYNPMALQQILNGTVFPSAGLLTDFAKLLKNFGMDVWGIWNEDAWKKAHSTKFILKQIPGVNSIANLFLPFIDPELAQELGIQISPQSRLH